MHSAHYTRFVESYYRSQEVSFSSGYIWITDADKANITSRPPLHCSQTSVYQNHPESVIKMTIWGSNFHAFSACALVCRKCMEVGPPNSHFYHTLWVVLIWGEGNVTLLQYSCLEKPMHGGAWKAAVHGVAKSQTWLSDFAFTFHFHALEKEMATHSSVLAWRIPGTGEPGGLPSMGSHRVRHDWSELAAAAAALVCSVEGISLWRNPPPQSSNLTESFYLAHCSVSFPITVQVRITHFLHIRDVSRTRTRNQRNYNERESKYMISLTT